MKKGILFIFAALVSFGSIAQVADTIMVAGTGNEFKYNPDSLVITIGDTVRWVNGFGNTATHPTSATQPSGAFPNFTIQLNSPVNDWVPTAPGTYEYECTTHAGLGMTGKIVVVGIPAGVQHNVFADEVKSYPNPTDGIVQMNFGSLTPDRVEVYNLMGQQVHVESVNGATKATLNLESLPSGSYFYRVVENETVVATRKLIIK